MNKLLLLFSFTLLSSQVFATCPKSASTFYQQYPGYEGENLVAECAEVGRVNPRNTIYNEKVDVCVYIGTHSIRKMPFLITKDLTPGQHFGTSYENNKFNKKAYQVIAGKHIGIQIYVEGDWGSHEEDREDITFDSAKLTLSAQKYDNVSPTPRLFTVWKKNDNAVMYRCKSILR